MVFNLEQMGSHQRLCNLERVLRLLGIGYSGKVQVGQGDCLNNFSNLPVGLSLGHWYGISDKMRCLR